MSLGIRLVPYLAYRIFFIIGSFEPLIIRSFKREIITLTLQSYSEFSE